MGITNAEVRMLTWKGGVRIGVKDRYLEWRVWGQIYVQKLSKANKTEVRVAKIGNEKKLQIALGGRAWKLTTYERGCNIVRV